MQQLLGCDESRYQATFVEKSFVICKCTEGLGEVDSTYASKKAQARTDGIIFGSYHFADSTDVSEAENEAKHFLANVGDIQPGDLLALDAEIGQSAEWCKTFLDYVTAQVGFKPFIYAPVGAWTEALDYPLWIARYGRNNGNINLDQPPAIGKWSNWTIWQYSSANNLDLDVFYGTIDQLKAYGKLATQTPVEDPTPSEPINVPQMVENVPLVNTVPLSALQNDTTTSTIPTTTQSSIDEPSIRTKEINELQILEESLLPWWSKLANIIKSIFSKI